MNINSANSLNDCTGCQLCAAICPKNAINVNLSIDGFYETVVEEDKCINCSLCLKNCYKFNTPTITHEAKAHYAAYAKNSNLLKGVSSGGIAHILSSSLIKKGYKCIGIVYDYEKDLAVNKLAKTESQIEAFKGSKYIQSYTYEAFRLLVNNHLNDKIAIFGTPCHIFALDKYLRTRNKRQNFILIDFYCHGCPSINLWKKYKSEVEAHYGIRNISKLSFRSKKYGWGNFNIEIESDGKIISSNNEKREFYDLFFSDYLLNKSCYNCKLRSTFKYSDIRLGDFWGKEYINNKKGVSIVSIISENGQRAFDSIKDKIIYTSHAFNDFIPFQSYGKTYKYNPYLRERMFILLQNPSVALKEIYSLFVSEQSTLFKAKRILKNIILRLPNSWINIIKYQYYKNNAK